MNLAAMAMRYRPVVITLVTLLTLWGCWTYITIPRREDPEFTIRRCVVVTPWPGASALKLEELVTDKLESALDGIQDVKELKSTTTEGLSIIYVELVNSVAVRDIQNSWDKIRAKVARVPMPDPRIRPIVNDDFGEMSVLILGIYQRPVEGETTVRPEVRYTTRELEEYADQIRDTFRSLPGVSKVEKHGVNNEAIYIESDLENWSNVDLTIDRLRQLVAARNIVPTGGSVSTETGKFNIKADGEFDAVSEIESILVGNVITDDSNNPVRLKDIGLDVQRSYVDPARYLCRFTDAEATYPAVILGVTMRSGANIIDVCETCVERLRLMTDVDQTLPGDLGVTPVSQQSDNVRAKMTSVINNVIEAILIVIVVVFLLVGGRTAAVMAANIPIVVLSSLAIIHLFGVQLEQVTLASIIISLGLLVDNAVQVCDQTRVNLIDGMNSKKAAIEAAKLLMLPMLIGTLTTVAAFVPMLYALKGPEAEYVYSLPVTLSTTLLLSWVFAMTICVVLAAGFIRAPKTPDEPAGPIPWLMIKLGPVMSKLTGNKSSSQETPTATRENIFMSFYDWSAGIAVRNKWLVIIASVGLLIGTALLPISTEFFPKDQRDQFVIYVDLPENASIEQTDEAVVKLEKIVRKLSPTVNEVGETVERLRAMRSIVGGGGSRWALAVDPPAPGSNVSELLVRTTDGKWTKSLVADIRRVANEGDEELGLQPIAGARISSKTLSVGPPADPVNIGISGEGFASIKRLRKMADEIKQLVEEHPDTWDVHDSWGNDGFQIKLDIDTERANLAGVTNYDIANTLSAYYSGVELTRFREGGYQIPVYFRLTPGDRRDLTGIESAYVEGHSGKIPLASIATAKPAWEPAKIRRKQLNRTVEIIADVEDGVSGNDVVLSIMRSKKMKQIIAELPIGYKITVGGSYEKSQESMEQMIVSFAISFLSIVFILVINYNGWSKTLLILATLPLAAMGAMFGLWISGNPLGFMPQLGLLSLFGIAINTGVIFIEFADILIGQRAQRAEATGESGPISGISREAFYDCLVQAGKQRMLPIFLTTATTVGGLLPLALSGGPLWEGLAWLMIYGLLIATVLTLYVLPALYAIVVDSFGIQPLAETE